MKNRKSDKIFQKKKGKDKGKGIDASITDIFTRKNIMTWPNLLTASRLVLAPIFMLLIMQGRFLAAFIIMLIAALTDFFDGLIARKFDMQSAFGRILDPVADKVLVFCVVIALLIRFGFPLWLGIIIISRDLMLLLAGLIFMILGKHSDLKPNFLGKLSTLFQLSSLTIYVIASALGYYAYWIGIWLYATAAITIVSGIAYIIKGYNILRDK